MVFYSTAYFWLQNAAISYFRTRFKLEIGAISFLHNLFGDWQDCRPDAVEWGKQSLTINQYILMMVDISYKIIL